MWRKVLKGDDVYHVQKEISLMRVKEDKIEKESENMFKIELFAWLKWQWQWHSDLIISTFYKEHLWFYG